MKYYGERLKEESWKGTGLKKAADFKSKRPSKLVSYINLTSTEAIHRGAATEQIIKMSR